jgi:putative glutathione S-transferase
VNNECSEIIRMFDSGFGELADNRIDHYPWAAFAQDFDETY